MKLVFLGPPGAGKGTHAKILAQKHSLEHIAAGDIFRKHIREKTPLGMKAKDTIEKGELVSDALVNEMVFSEMRKAGLDKGFLLDGYPRTIGQAEALDAFLKENSLSLDAVLDFETSEAVVLDRLSGRRVNLTTGKVYHVRNMPPKVAGICDETGEALIQRKDDEPETVKNRLKVYYSETAPLIDYYRKQGVLFRVPGDYDVPELQQEIKELFERLKLLV